LANENLSNRGKRWIEEGSAGRQPEILTIVRLTLSNVQVFASSNLKIFTMLTILIMLRTHHADLGIVNSRLDSQHFSDHQNVLIAIWNVRNRKLIANDGNQQSS
jgi:predicted XRE-type DNA-binding protein